MKAFYNLVICQGESRRIQWFVNHSIVAAGDASASTTELSVNPLPALVPSSTVLIYPNGTATLSSDGAIGSELLQVTVTGSIADKDSAKGPAVNMGGRNFRGQVRSAYDATAVLMDIQFDVANASNGQVDLIFPSDLTAAVPANITPSEANQVAAKFKVARVPKDFKGLERYISQKDPWYFWDFESYDGATPPDVDRHGQGYCLCVAEVTK